MTAYHALARSDGGHIISDGARVDVDGVLTGVVSKVALFPAFNLAVAVTGFVLPEWIHEDMDDARPSNLAEAVQALPGIAHGITGRCKASAIAHPHCSIVAVAWDRTIGAAAWTVATHWSSRHLGIAPCTVVRGRAFLDITATPETILGRSVDPLDPASFDLETDGLALMEHCRRTPADPELWGGRRHYGVGGMVEITTAGPDGLRTRKIKEWREDVVGRRIEPAGAGAAAERRSRA